VISQIWKARTAIYANEDRPVSLATDYCSQLKVFFSGVSYRLSWYWWAFLR